MGARARLRLRLRLCRVGWHRWLDTRDEILSMPGYVLVGRYCPYCLTRTARPRCCHTSAAP